MVAVHALDFVKKPFVLAIDRNILSSLLKFCEKGSLKDEEESQIIGIIMAWAQLNDIAISAGQALRERSTQTGSQEEGLIELQKFLEVFEYYPGQMWLQVARGTQSHIPPIVFSQSPAQNITVNYADGGDHYDMAVAALLHAVCLYRDKSMKAVDKLLSFFQWTYDHVLVGGYIWSYAILLFAETENIKAPKHANSKDIDKIIAGCENQAWDIAHLSTWSTLYANTEEYDFEFLFATNDILLKRIIINSHGPDELNGLLYEVFSQKEYDRICDYLEEKIRPRALPDFGSDSRAYFQALIDSEKKNLLKILAQES
jgi:hypothetical protein